MLDRTPMLETIVSELSWHSGKEIRSSVLLIIPGRTKRGDVDLWVSQLWSFQKSRSAQDDNN
jgi:hypothetical protein